MFRREHQECTAVKRVGSRSEDANLLIYVLNLEIDLRPFASANPVALEQFDCLRPIQFVESVNQSLGKGSDPQHPLPHWSSHNRKSANFALAIYHLFVGQNCAEFGTPVDRNISDVSEANTIRIGSRIGRNRLSSIRLRVEPRIVDLQKYPLCPFKIRRVGRVDLPLPIVRKTDP